MTAALDVATFGDPVRAGDRAQQAGRRPAATVVCRSQKKSPLFERAAGRENAVGWLMGLEPTTTGITILDSTN
jgi:hypothetical protein